MNKCKTIHELKLHNECSINSCTNVLRVPGGWLYQMWSISGDEVVFSTFVPFDKEFQITEEAHKWWLISNEDMKEVRKALLAPAQKKALHTLDSGLHTTNAVPSDFK